MKPIIKKIDLIYKERAKKIDLKILLSGLILSTYIAANMMINYYSEPASSSSLIHITFFIMLLASILATVIMTKHKILARMNK